MTIELLVLLEQTTLYSLMPSFVFSANDQ